MQYIDLNAFYTERAYICGELRQLNATDLLDITAEDVANQLSRINRYNGAIGRLSVAAHSVRVARYLPRHFKLAGLLHDIGECAVGDIPRPLKSICPDLKVVEALWQVRLSETILSPFPHVDVGQALELMRSNEVHFADNMDAEFERSRQGILAAERAPADEARAWLHMFCTLTAPRTGL